jgi:hypothetical protein
MKIDLVQFLCNTPVQVSLLSLSPTPRTGVKGTKYFYVLSDGSGMWADEDLNTRIQKFASPGELFWIDLGALGLLCECSVHVPEDLREMIDAALSDAQEANPELKVRRILNRFEIEAA